MLKPHNVYLASPHSRHILTSSRTRRSSGSAQSRHAVDRYVITILSLLELLIIPPRSRSYQQSSSSRIISHVPVRTAMYHHARIRPFQSSPELARTYPSRPRVVALATGTPATPRGRFNRQRDDSANCSAATGPARIATRAVPQTGQPGF